MAQQKEIAVSASASLSANGTSTATGSIAWNAPALPAGATGWDGIRVVGTWSWGGRGNITRVTINGTNTSASIPFEVSIAGKTSPLSITCVGGNKNATGNSFTWSGLQVIYTYTDNTETDAMFFKLNGAWREVVPFIKVDGSWMQVEPSSVDVGANYVVLQ